MEKLKWTQLFEIQRIFNLETLKGDNDMIINIYNCEMIRSMI